MSDREKAKIILEAWDRKFYINWNHEDGYLSAIMEGLQEIREKEQGDGV